MAMWIYDMGSLRVLAVNAAALAQYGCSRDQFLSLRTDQLYPEPERTVFRRQALAVQTSKVWLEQTRNLRADGSIIDVRISASLVHRSSGPARLVVAHDITDELQTARLALKAQQELAFALNGTIEAIAATLAQRDPYTGGHQRRVAGLAVAIGRKLGVDADTLEGIRLAATIHDIGKIGLPSEVLMFPGPISPVMFEVIKTHCQIGHDIIAGVRLPWPIAQIVLQHHERLDGSGYPQGLRGHEILRQAQIVAVADVADAMTSHRPYRPALGIDEALDELQRHRAVEYAADAVDACVALFTSAEFAFDAADPWRQERFSPRRATGQPHSSGQA